MNMENYDEEELKEKKKAYCFKLCPRKSYYTRLSAIPVLNCTAVMWLGGLILWHCLELQGRCITSPHPS